MKQNIMKWIEMKCNKTNGKMKWKYEFKSEMKNKYENEWKKKENMKQIETNETKIWNENMNWNETKYEMKETSFSLQIFFFCGSSANS